VKIDRAFTQGLGQDPKVDLIVRSIISLAHSLQIRVNAEGVETVEQLRALQQQGCDELQGFLLGRPAPLQALAPGTARQAAVGAERQSAATTTG
jgi:EAL domain-containing protein (putative c-di-GMP-specific phosphodiesterase class I)